MKPAFLIHVCQQPLRYGLVAVIVGSFAVACSDALSSHAARPASVSFSVVRPQNANTAAIVLSDASHTLDLQSVDVVFKKIKLEGETGLEVDDSDTDTDSDGPGEDKIRIEVAGATVALPLEGGVVTPFTVEIPVGTYDELEMELAFVRLRGTYDDQAFDVTLPVEGELELEMDPSFEVASSADVLNVTIDVDVAQFFRVNGAVIDPRLLQTDGDMLEDFQARVRDAFDAFEDSDKDADESDSDSDTDGD